MLNSVNGFGAARRPRVVPSEIWERLRAVNLARVLAFENRAVQLTPLLALGA
jgi:hypothetical protein